MAEAQKKSGGNRKFGRNDEKCKKYRVNKTREKNKIRNVLQSEGIAAAEKYAEQHELYAYLRKLTAA
jgi:hypothetical protein